MELGSGSLYYMNAAMMTTCMCVLADYYIIDIFIPDSFQDNGFFDILVLLVIVLVHKLGFYTLIGYMSRKESHILLQLYPGAILLITGLSIYYTGKYRDFDWADYTLFPLWFSIYILVRFGSPGENCPFYKKFKVAARLSRAILIVTAIYALSTWFRPITFPIIFGPPLIGNLQTPMALTQILLSSTWLFGVDIKVHDTKNENVKLAVKIFYIMVLCQGMLYMAACILEPLSFLFRRSMALGCGLVDKSGMKSIDLYYEQAYDTFLQESLFDTTKKMGLVTFAVDILNPKASWDKKHAAVRILDSFLQKNKTSSSNAKLISLITASTKAVTTLINMLGWIVTEDAHRRLFAAKVIAHIAPYLQIVRIPGTMQKVYSLLDAQDQLMTKEMSTQIEDGNGGNADDQQINNDASSLTMNNNRRDVVDRQQTIHGFSSNSPLDIERGKAPAVHTSSTEATRKKGEGCSLMERIRGFLRHAEKLLSIPQEDPTDDDTLPALGMQILEGLAHDLHNCAEIIRATELLPKIIGFISYVPGTTAVQRERTTTSSLKLLAKLASVKGKIGITLRQELSENPFLIGNLAEILELEGTSSYLQQSKLAMNIIARIAMDEKTRQNIGTIQVIMDKLVQEFLGEDELSNPLRAEAGEALAMVAIESPNNCSAMLDKSNYELIGDLANKLQRGTHVYPAATLLQCLCKNSNQLVLSHQGSIGHLLSTLTVVLGGIQDAQGKQMDALFGLASQICSTMPERIAPVLESFPDDEAFVKKLVCELKARKRPSPDDFPDTRRLLIELTVSIVKFCPRYALIFREHGMMEALSKVEQYAGLLVSEEQGALRAMLARAKGLIGADTV